jgi:hypothetical protein
VRAGEVLDGWRVSVTDPRTVELENGAERRTLTMFTAPASPEAPSPTPEETPPPPPDDDGPPSDSPPDDGQQ